MATVHPRPEIVERYDVAGGRSFRTDYDGALTFDFDRGTRRAPQAPREHEARYWREARVRGELPPLE